MSPFDQQPDPPTSKKFKTRVKFRGRTKLAARSRAYRSVAWASTPTPRPCEDAAGLATNVLQRAWRHRDCSDRASAASPRAVALLCGRESAGRGGCVLTVGCAHAPQRALWRGLPVLVVRSSTQLGGTAQRGQQRVRVPGGTAPRIPKRVWRRKSRRGLSFRPASCRPSLFHDLERFLPSFLPLKLANVIRGATREKGVRGVSRQPRQQR